MSKKEIDIKNFSHQTKEQVKFHEVDLLGVCNNAVYFNYFEDGRLKYVNDLKAKYNFKEFLQGNSFFIMVHNYCDYYESAHLDDELIIYTRINFIKNSSYGYEHVVQKVSTGKIIASGGGVVVHIDKLNQKPIPLPQEFYDAVKAHEKNVDILKDIT
ncbi:MAG: thioesterase family protein [Melioribacteraceae bacterium]|nr:MAG: thioesterase family protein [Melioribacteraceae bacterium]